MRTEEARGSPLRLPSGNLKSSNASASVRYIHDLHGAVSRAAKAAKERDGMKESEKRKIRNKDRLDEFEKKALQDQWRRYMATHVSG